MMLNDKEFRKELLSRLEQELSESHNIKDCIKELSHELVKSIKRIETFIEAINLENKGEVKP